MRISVLCLLIALTLTAGTAPGHDAPPASAGSAVATLSLAQAVERAQRAYGARAVRAEEVREADEVVYRIRLLAADGRVFTVRVNARTGTVD